MNPFKAVKDFHTKYGLSLDKDVNDDNVTELLLRDRLLHEEMSEVVAEYRDKALYNDEHYQEVNKQNLTKELADLIYVTIGFATSFNLPLEEVFERIHNANMTKSGNVDGKVTKGPNFVPAEVGDLFE